MEAEHQKGMQTKWIYTLFSIGIAIFFLDNWLGSYCFSKDWINDSMLSWSIFIGVILVSIFYIVLERYNFMVVDNALNDKSSAKKLTSFTVFSYVFCIFLFGSMFVGGMINSGIDLAILISAKNPTEFRYLM